MPKICGATQHRAKVIDDTPSAGLKVLSFFILFAGLILFVVQSKDISISAKEYGKWVLIGFCIGIALSIVWYIYIVLASVSSMFKNNIYLIQIIDIQICSYYFVSPQTKSATFFTNYVGRKAMEFFIMKKIFSNSIVSGFVVLFNIQNTTDKVSYIFPAEQIQSLKN